MMSIGSDPEFFIRDSRTGSVKPICGLLGGTKNAPIPIPGLGDGKVATMQEDNVMGEFNTIPTDNPQVFADSVAEIKRSIEAHLQSINSHYEFDTSCARLFTEDLLQSKSAQLFGCSPDYDAYTNDGDVFPAINPKTLAEADGQWRFAGGHIHLGYDVKIPPFVVANLADIFIGLRSIRYDKQGPRRQLYGQPGRFRPKSYGVEYRTLSNYWIFSKQKSYEVASHAGELLYYLYNNDVSTLQQSYAEVPWGDVRKAIIEEDEKLAKNLTRYCFSELGMTG